LNSAKLIIRHCKKYWKQSFNCFVKNAKNMNYFLFFVMLLIVCLEVKSDLNKWAVFSGFQFFMFPYFLKVSYHQHDPAYFN
jgi:hypothetical protein